MNYDSKNVPFDNFINWHNWECRSFYEQCTSTINFGVFLSVAVSSPTDEMNAVPGMKLDMHINHFPNTTAAVVPQAHQEPVQNLAVQSGG